MKNAYEQECKIIERYIKKTGEFPKSDELAQKHTVIGMLRLCGSKSSFHLNAKSVAVFMGFSPTLRSTYP